MLPSLPQLMIPIWRRHGSGKDHAHPIPITRLIHQEVGIILWAMAAIGLAQYRERKPRHRFRRRLHMVSQRSLRLQAQVEDAFAHVRVLQCQEGRAGARCLPSTPLFPRTVWLPTDQTFQAQEPTTTNPSFQADPSSLFKGRPSGIACSKQKLLRTSVQDQPDTLPENQ